MLRERHAVFPMMHCEASAEMFEIMAQALNTFDLPSNSMDEETYSASKFNEDNEKQGCLLFSTENDIGIFDDNKVFTFQSDDSTSCGRSVGIKEQPSLPALPGLNPSLKAKNATEKTHTTAGLGLNPKLFIVNDSDNKENAAVPAPGTTGM